MGVVRAIFLSRLIGAVAPAVDLHGTVVIEEKLTRRNSSAPVGAYQRGVAVDLEPTPRSIRSPLNVRM